MSALVTAMIPTRKRTSRLFPTLEQLKLSATGTDYEIIIRIDDDDQESLAAKLDMESYPNVRVEVGPRLGYANLDRGYYSGMEEQSTTPWVWIAGDDMLVSGDWLGELRKVPLEGYIVQPEISRLGMSTYPRAEAQAFPIFPKFCWKKCKHPFNVPVFPKPFDTVGHEMLRQIGWQTWFLEGVTMWHDRPPEHEIWAHRNL